MQKSVNYKPCKLLIGIPCMEMIHTEFFKNMMGLLTYLNAEPLPCGYFFTGYNVYTVLTSVLSNKREEIIQTAIKHECTHILFLDSDQSFPHDLVHRLLRHEKDCVAANCAIKTIPSAPTARRLNHKGKLVPVMPRHPEESKKNPLEMVHMVGCGVMLLTTRSIKKMGKGLFEVTWQKDIDGYRGEDWSFITAYKKAGHSVYIDHDVSWDVGHMGMYRYDYPLIWQQERNKVFLQQREKDRKELENAA